MKSLKVFALVIVMANVSAAQKEVPLPKDLPAYAAEQPLQAPNVRSSKLDNGLTVWLVSQPGLPKVAFAAAVRGGFAADPADRPGITELLSKTIDQGTKSRTAKQISQELQAAGGDLSVESSKDFIQVTTAVLSSKVDAGLTILFDILQNASFPEAEVALAKRNLADSLRERESQPSFLAARAMATVLFKDHPYHVTAPTQESIAASTASDLRNTYALRVRPDQAVLVAVGDFDNDKMLGLAKAQFGGWKAPGGAALAATPPPTVSPQHAVFVVGRPGSVQTTLQLGTLGPKRSDPDFEAAEVANAIYGGTFSSRLVSNIREDKGYTYSPGASLRTYRQAGVLVTRADVRNEVTAPSLNEITYELNRLAITTPSDEELTKAKRFLVGSEALSLQVRSAVAAELAKIWVDGLPPDEIGIYSQRIATTTSAEVDAAARKYFPASRSAIVAVGEEKIIRDALAPFGLTIQTTP
jgi:zinc protease